MSIKVDYKRPILSYEHDKCNEIFIDEEESKRIDSLTNNKYYREAIDNIRKYQLRLRRKVSYSGRSLVIRIPKDIERVLSIKDGEEVEIYPEGKDKIIIEKIG